MSLIRSKAIQMGYDATPSNNFLIYQPLTPDGTFRIANGNQGATTDIMTVSSTGNVTFAGSTNFASLNFGSGSVTAPSLYPTGDSNTGLFFPAADTVGITTGGTERLRIDSNGNLLVGSTNSYGSGSYGLRVSNTVTNGYGAVSLQGNRSVEDDTAGLLQCFNSSSEISRISFIQGSNATSGKISFLTSSSGSLSEKMRIDSTYAIHVNYSLAIAGAAAPAVTDNERITLSNSYDGTTQARYYGASATNQKYLNVGWNLQTYGGGSSGYMINGVTGIYRSSAGSALYVAGDTQVFGSLSANGFTNATPTFTERMRIASDGNVGIGTSALQTNQGIGLQVGNTSGGNISIGTGTAAGSNSSPIYTDLSFRGYANFENARIRCWDEASSTGQGNLTFWTQTGTGMVERMRITHDGRVGIGTTNVPALSPYAKLAVYSASSTAQQDSIFATDYNRIALSVGAQNKGSYIQLYTEASASYVTGIGTAVPGFNSENALIFSKYSGGWSEQMRIDSSGNLGLGVTPSAWGSSYKALQNISGFFSSDGNGANYTTVMGNNAYFDSSDTRWEYYRTGNGASLYRQNNSSGAAAHSWYIAPSGTAGDAISFTQAMTLDASGNLALGTTSVTGFWGSTSVNARNVVSYSNSGTTFDTSVKGLVVTNSDTTAGNFSSLVFGTNNSWGSSVATAAVYSVNKDARVVGFTTADLAFATVGGSGVLSERARIDSSGRVFINSTSSSFNPALGLVFDPTNGPLYNGIVVRTTTNGSGSAMAFLNSSGIGSGSIVINASSTNYNTSSDYRLKENIQPMQNALATVAQLNPVTYTWKADGSDGQGFIAHELQSVVPDCVTGEKDAVDAEGNPVYQGVDTSFLVATLTKAIQEQQEIIESLKARLDAAGL